MSNNIPYRYQKSTRSLREIRRRIFEYPAHLEAKAERVLIYLKARHMRDRNLELSLATRGPWSRLTRRELAATGTCETDWF